MRNICFCAPFHYPWCGQYYIPVSSESVVVVCLNNIINNSFFVIIHVLWWLCFDVAYKFFSIEITFKLSNFCVFLQYVNEIMSIVIDLQDYLYIYLPVSARLIHRWKLSATMSSRRTLRCVLVKVIVTMTTLLLVIVSFLFKSHRYHDNSFIGYNIVLIQKSLLPWQLLFGYNIVLIQKSLLLWQLLLAIISFLF